MLSSPIYEHNYSNFGMMQPECGLGAICNIVAVDDGLFIFSDLCIGILFPIFLNIVAVDVDISEIPRAQNCCAVLIWQKSEKQVSCELLCTMLFPVASRAS